MLSLVRSVELQIPFWFRALPDMKMGMPQLDVESGRQKSPGQSVRSEQLIARCQRGDRQAFDELYATYAPKLFRICHLLTGDSEDAKDSLQLTFTQAFRSIHKFNHSSQIFTWLYAITVRVAANQRRSKRRWWRLRQAYTVSDRRLAKAKHVDMEGNTADRQLLELLEGALEHLAEEKRTAFILHYVEQRSLREVASLMGATEQTTRARVVTARDQLQKISRQRRWELP